VGAERNGLMCFASQRNYVFLRVIQRDFDGHGLAAFAHPTAAMSL